AAIRPEIKLFDTRQEQIARELGSTGVPNQLIHKVCDTGTYYFTVEHYLGSVSSEETYAVNLTFDTTDVYECNDNFLSAKQLTLCDTIFGAIYPISDQDFYSITSEAEDTTIIDFGDLNPDIGISLYAYGPNQAQVTLQQEEPGDPVYLIAQDSGQYYIQVIAQNSSQSSQQLYSLVFQTTAGCTTTSTNQILTGGTISLFPNPAQDNVTVEYGERLADKRPTLRIFSADGRLYNVYPQVENGQSLDLSNIPAGVLFFQFRVDEEVATMRVVKQPGE
ncbi:MAG: T9SS type A sorting domain-containing protein, partial [Lewinella sp.]